MSLLHLHPRVLQALQAGTPIVVLESTVISHGGLGYPRNLQTAQELERQVEAAGAVPATIAVMHGQVKIGLDAEEMELLATSSAVAKLSKRDLAPALARPGSLGSTTVAATMFLAHRALGPCVFATGGLGGVHRGAFGGPHPSLDVSADLTELSRTPVTVVCSGVKSILDVPGTLEFLELLSVPVLCYRTKWFPTFFTHDSGIEAGFTADSPAECAQVMAGALQLATGAGLVVAVPNPDPLPDAERFIQQAERECAALTTDAARGKRATPWLLKRVAELSAGRSQGSNVALLKRNAFVAGEIAVKFAQTRRRHLHSGGTHARDASRVVVVGGAAVDTRAVVAPVAEGTAAPAASLLLASRTSLPGQIYVDVGGVGRNVSCNVGLACAALGVARRPLLIAAVGDDAQGRMVEASLSAAHVRVSGLCVAGGRRTPHVVELLGSGGEMLVGVADFALALRLEDLRRHAGALERARVVVVDGNAAGLLDCVRGLAGRGAGLFFEPTSVSKAAAGAAFLRYFDCVTPNARELSALARTLPAAGGDVAGLEGVEDAVARDAARVFAEMTLLGAARRPKTLLVSMGSRGVLLMHAFRGEVFRGTRRAPSERDATLGAWEAGACVTGAGDAQMGVLAFLAGHLPSAMACPELLLALATRAAARTVRARQSVSALVGEGLRRDLASSGKALEC